MSISAPHVDAEEIARVDPRTDLQLAVAIGGSGTVWASFDASGATAKEASSGGTVTFSPNGRDVELVTVLFHAGPTLYTSAFRVRTTADASAP